MLARHPLDDRGTDTRTEVARDIYIALAETPAGGEDIVAVHSALTGGWTPLVCTGLSPAAVAAIRQRARDISRRDGRRIRIVRFSHREVEAVFEGAPASAGGTQEDLDAVGHGFADAPE